MKRLVCVGLALMILLSLSSVAYASNTEECLVANNRLYGTHSVVIEDAYYESDTLLKNTYIDALEIGVSADKLCLSGRIVTNDGSYVINTSGRIYRFRSASGADSFLVDFSNNEGIHFVQARIIPEQRATNLHLMMQVEEDESFLSFCIPFSTIANIGDSRLPIVTTDNQTAFSLYNISQNILSPDTSTINVSASSSGAATATIVSPQGIETSIRASYDTEVDDDVWDDFFSELHSNGSVALSDYEIDERILNNGWVFLNNSTANTGKYSIACYTSQNGSYDKLVQITFLEVVHQSSNPSWARLQMTIRECIYLSYNMVSEEFDVLFYGVGPIIEDLGLALTLPGGSSSRTVFISKRLECNLADSPSTLESVIALVPYLSTAYDVWNILASDGAATTLNYTHTYEDSYSAQYAEYDGDVRRFIAGTTGNHELDREAHSFSIYGDIYAGYAGCSGWTYEYSASRR